MDTDSAFVPSAYDRDSGVVDYWEHAIGELDPQKAIDAKVIYLITCTSSSSHQITLFVGNLDVPTATATMDSTVAGNQLQRPEGRKFWLVPDRTIGRRHNDA